MLLDCLVKYCDSFYRNHVNDQICEDCNHPADCPGDCKKCLDEVHWIKRGKRRDYDCEYLVYYYTCRYSHKYCSEILYALENIDLEEYPRYNILSLGCGATPDLMAFDYLNELDKKPIRYRGYDRNPLWKPIHNEIENYMLHAYEDIKIKLRCNDVFRLLVKDKARKGVNIITMQYLLSHLYNTMQTSEINDLYDALIDNVLKYRCDDSPFLIIINDIDSCYKGRNYFWPLYDKIRAACYRGRAYAMCFKKDINLEHAQQYPSSTNKFSIPNTICKHYKCAIECSSAQLIIEIR